MRVNLNFIVEADIYYQVKIITVLPPAVTKIEYQIPIENFNEDSNKKKVLKFSALRPKNTISILCELDEW
jgi:hypothetical protein